MRLVTVVAIVAVATLPVASAGQEVPSTAEAPTPPDDTVSPRGAFLRAVALPGWGHTAIGSYTRGGFYFTAEAGTLYAVLRARRRLAETREHLSFREDVVRRRIEMQGIEDPEEVDAALAEDEILADLVLLEESRAQQQEDLIAFGIFLLFLSGADAYVSAHLSGFPEPLEVETEATDDGRVTVGLRVRVPW